MPASATKSPSIDQTEPRQGFLKEASHFVRAFIKDPVGIGAVLPSGQALARAMTRPMDREAGRVLELGSGTGVFARHLLGMGFDPDQLVLVEQDAKLATRLRSQFPGATVLQMSALDVSTEAHPCLSGISATLCGLPLRNMDDGMHYQLLQAAFGTMPDLGILYLFTYGATCPIAPAILAQCHLKASRTQRILRNVPPAAIYRVTRMPS